MGSVAKVEHRQSPPASGFFIINAVSGAVEGAVGVTRARRSACRVLQVGGGWMLQPGMWARLGELCQAPGRIGSSPVQRFEFPESSEERVFIM